MNGFPDVMDLLANGVPISLLVDLLDETGPDSHRFFVEEQPDVEWLPESVRRAVA